MKIDNAIKKLTFLRDNFMLLEEEMNELNKKYSDLEYEKCKNKSLSVEDLIKILNSPKLKTIRDEINEIRDRESC